MIKMKSIDETIKCLWKKMEENPDSTTFMQVRNNPSHKLYDCVVCKGEPYSCPNYHKPFETRYDGK